MEKRLRERNITLVIGIGLVLVGLLAGIFTMLLLDRQEATGETPRVVERVELGSRDALRPQLAAETDRAEGPVGALTLNQMFKQVASHVTPAVVYLEIEQGGSADFPRDLFHQFDEESRERFFQDNMPRQSVGSGVIISPQGYVVTNHHVVEGADKIRVVLSDKRQYTGEVVGVDRSTDLAVVKIEDSAGLPVIPLGDSDGVQVGEWVLAVGNPFRLTSTVTAGIVSALGRQVNIIEDEFSIEDFIQTDAAINPGNSGGALVNLGGELVGISTAIATESGSYEGYGFAVPVNLMARVVTDIIEHGEVQRGFLGVTIQEVDARAARRLGLGQIQGVFLENVRRDGAAYRAGLRKGDVVLSIQGHGVNAPNELQSAVARFRPGEDLDVEVWRRGSRRHFAVQLMGRDDPAYREWFSELRRDPAPPAPTPEVLPEAPELGVFELEEWGLGVRAINGSERDAFEVQGGVYVAYVENGSLASRAGLPRDVVMTHVGSRAVESVEDALAALARAAEVEEAVLLRIRRRDGLAAFYEIEVLEAQ